MWKTFKQIRLLALIIGIQTACYGAAHLEDSAPASRQYKILKGLTNINRDLPSSSKGEIAEKEVDKLFRSNGYSICPGKYFPRKPNTVNHCDLDPAQGMDGLYIKFNRQGGIDHIVVNESKFQQRGGSPRLSTMDCAYCSGGHGKTAQMSWRWIHNAVEQAIERASTCSKTTTSCNSILTLLSQENVLKLIIRTATVMNDKGELHLYSLFNNEWQKSVADSMWENMKKK